MRTALYMLVFAASASAGCVEVPAGQIVARDLFEAVPLFRALDPDTAVGFAPLPGLQRILSARELLLFARQHALVPNAGTVLPSVCVVRLARPLSSADMKAALIASLGVANATIELLEFSNQPVAPGRLEFPLGGLISPPADAPESPVIWRGRLLYDGQRGVSIWAKVRITIETRCMVAAEAIPWGTVIRAEQVQDAVAPRFPFSAPALDSPREVVGTMARRNIAAGQIFRASALEKPRDVTKGDRIRVRVLDGLAFLSFEALAESSGGIGDTIVVHNPSSGRNFRAVVEAKGRAFVQSSPGA